MFPKNVIRQSRQWLQIKRLVDVESDSDSDDDTDDSDDDDYIIGARYYALTCDKDRISGNGPLDCVHQFQMQITFENLLILRASRRIRMLSQFNLD